MELKIRVLLQIFYTFVLQKRVKRLEWFRPVLKKNIVSNKPRFHIKKIIDAFTNMGLHKADTKY